MKLNRFPLITLPFALLVLLFLSFGLLIPWLGFFWDDWPVIMVAKLQGARGYWEFYQIDRPFSAWTFILSTPLLGVRPLVWHVFTLLLRWFTVLGLWFSLRLLWPKRTQTVTWIAVLFAIYPAFDLQPVSVAFSQHWITYGLFFLSLATMLLSHRRAHKYRRLTIVGIASQAAHLLTMEYFLGLELLRPVLLWMLFTGSEGSEREGEAHSNVIDRQKRRMAGLRSRLLLILRHWLPYLIVLVIYLVYRLVFLKLPDDDPYRPVLLSQLFQHPLVAVRQFLELVIPDLLFILFGSWYQTVDPARLPFHQPIVFFSLGAGLITAFLTALYLQRLAITDKNTRAGWNRQAFALGALVLLFGPLPIWITGKQAFGGLYGSRFLLTALFGASLLVIAFLEWLKAGIPQKAILIAVLVGLATSHHLRTANDFRWSWIKQTGFYWQLHWRAPWLQQGTILLSDGEIFPYVGINSTSAALNLLYPPPEGTNTLAYWFSDLYRGFGKRNVENLSDGLAVQRQLRSYWYKGTSRDSLVVFYEPEGGRCLWVLSPEDDDNPELPEITVNALPASNLGLIGPEATLGFPPEAIFGPEPEHTWCYYYQKAELARQMGDWKTVLTLGDEAWDKGFSPNNPQEWLPFIEAYAYTGRWSDAVDRTRHVWRVDHDLAPRLCRLWQNVEGGVDILAEEVVEVRELKERIGCGGKP